MYYYKISLRDRNNTHALIVFEKSVPVSTAVDFNLFFKFIFPSIYVMYIYIYIKCR